MKNKSEPGSPLNDVGLEVIQDKEIVYGIIVRASFTEDGIRFFTPSEYSQQLGYMRRNKGYTIAAHYHNPVIRKVTYTQEVLFVKSGMIKVIFYDSYNKPFTEKILRERDTILLAGGGHSFEFLEQSEVIEVKQGPYTEDLDKTHFDAK